MPTFVYGGLRHAAFPDSGHPDALVYVPTRIDPTRLGVVMYLHGFDNCIENVAAPAPGVHDPPHPTADLITQIEESGKNAILFLPETRYHEQSRDPGALGEAGGLRRLLDEVLLRVAADHAPLAALQSIAAGPSAAIVRTVLAAHSGSYRAAACMVRDGGVDIQELFLLDALYKDTELYDDILTSIVASLSTGAARRFVNLYRAGGTAAHSLLQVEHLRRQLAAQGLAADLLHADDEESEPADEQLSHPLLVKRVPTAHSDFGRTYVGRLLRTGGLPAIG